MSDQPCPVSPGIRFFGSQADAATFTLRLAAVMLVIETGWIGYGIFAPAYREGALRSNRYALQKSISKIEQKMH